MRCQLLELGDDVGLAGKVLVTAARRLERTCKAPAIAQRDLHAHFMAMLRAFGRDGWIGGHADARGERHAARIALGARLELRDEAVALEKQRRGAEREV